ncbi:MAG TPA: hypothetical protein VHY09_06145 [Candidatus Methylacidiphilales bacterium]|jgi:hypothetical protein|nr:hypothetical protein [Candidatus Methylacidiphilales bacterium]
MMLIPFSALLLVTSFILNRNTSTLSHDDSMNYEQRHVREVLAKILFVTGLLVMSAAIVAVCLWR